MKARTLFGAAALLVAPGLARSAEITLLASPAVRAACVELIPDFEKATGHKVTASWSSSPDIEKRVAGGEAADLIILGDAGADSLIKQGKIVAASRVNFAQTGIAVAVRAGAPKPAIGSAEAVKNAVLAAKSVAFSAGASGTYLIGMFEKLGVYEQVKAKQATVKPGEAVGAVVARGDAEIGFHQMSELVPVAGIDIIGPLPPELQHVTVFAGGVLEAAKEPKAASALIQFLTAPTAAANLKRHGLEPS